MSPDRRGSPMLYSVGRLGSVQLRPGWSLMSWSVVAALCNRGLASKRAEVREALAGSGEDVGLLLDRMYVQSEPKLQNVKISLLPYLDI